VIYSVWNQAAGAFDYFEDDRTMPVLNADKPAHIVSRTLGSTVDQAAWPLPADARPAGQGTVPVGRIASRGGAGAGALGDVSGFDPLTFGMMLVCGVVAWRVLMPRRRRR
jgi:hypothetical protein